MRASKHTDASKRTAATSRHFGHAPHMRGFSRSRFSRTTEGAGRGVRDFALMAIVDGLLVLAVVVGLSYAVCSGFESTLALRGNVLAILGVSAPLLCILYFGSYSKGTVALGGIASITWCAIVFLAATVLSGDTSAMKDGAVNDVAGNYRVFCAVVIVIALFVFFLSRRPASALVLVGIAIAVCGCVQFLFRDWLADEGGELCFTWVFASTLVLAVFQRYRARVMTADALTRLSPGTAVAQGCVLAGVALALSYVAWVGVVVPLELSTTALKPFERVIARPVVEFTGGYEQMLVENPDNATSATNDDVEQTHDNAEGGADDARDESAQAENPLSQFVDSLTVFDADDWEEQLSPSLYEKFKLDVVLVALVCVVLVCVCAVGGRLLWRRIRFARWKRLPADEGIRCLYRFLLDRLEKLGLGKPPEMTPLEYAFVRTHALRGFTRNTGKVDFIEVTLIYQRAAYGAGDVSARDWSCVERYYRMFFPNAHRHVGTARWLVYFWRI